MQILVRPELHARWDKCLREKRVERSGSLLAEIPSLHGDSGKAYLILRPTPSREIWPRDACGWPWFDVRLIETDCSITRKPGSFRWEIGNDLILTGSSLNLFEKERLRRGKIDEERKRTNERKKFANIVTPPRSFNELRRTVGSLSGETDRRDSFVYLKESGKLANFQAITGRSSELRYPASVGASAR